MKNVELRENPRSFRQRKGRLEIGNGEEHLPGMREHLGLMTGDENQFKIKEMVQLLRALEDPGFSSQHLQDG